MSDTSKNVQEWLIQAAYDLDTARFMLSGGRNIYAIFMAHLALEKVLKAVYLHRFNDVPPKTHSLMLLLQRAGIHPPDTLGEFIADLDQSSVATRYPERLLALQTAYTNDVVVTILDRANEVMVWAKTML
ncbi:MAG: HEPN domain-containing protein [Candidatus Omnitrophica bacterium]|nr:HEPN domain-containing protein [Candidatus Omnitrophota bacterium]